jgi:ribosomal RNA assembly protein
VEQKVYIKIPMERIGVLIGPKGREKRRLEAGYKVSLTIDSESGAVEIALSPEAEDITVLFTVQSIINAIGRGFSPSRAEKLAEEDYNLLVIDLTDYVGTSKNAIARVKGRIIGRNGRSRALLEELTESSISVYGRTVGLIGRVEDLDVAKEAVLMLVKGAFHKTVWNFLYTFRRKIKKERSDLWEETPEPRAELR